MNEAVLEEVVEEKPSSQEVSSEQADATPVSPYVERIDAACAELQAIAESTDTATRYSVDNAVSDALAAWKEAQDAYGADSPEMQAVEAAWNAMWPASLCASTTLAVRNLEALDAITTDQLSSDPNMHYAHAFNDHLDAAVSSTARLWAGAQCNVEVLHTSPKLTELQARVRSHVLRMQESNPNHRFPQSVAVEHILSDNNS